MRIVDLSMTVDECDSAPFAPDENYFKLRPIIKWEDKGFVSNVVQMTVHVGTHIDSPHHFFRDKPSIEKLPLEPMFGKAVVLDLTAKGVPRARITPEDLNEADATFKTPEELLAFNKARRPDPSTGQPDINKVGEFLAQHPETMTAVNAAITRLEPGER